MSSENIYSELVKITTTKDEKAELTLLSILMGKSRTQRKVFCKSIDCPWEEYQRLKRKYSRVIERFKKEKGEI